MRHFELFSNNVYSFICKQHFDDFKCSLTKIILSKIIGCNKSNWFSIDVDYILSSLWSKLLIPFATLISTASSIPSHRAIACARDKIFFFHQRCHQAIFGRYFLFHSAIYKFGLFGREGRTSNRVQFCTIQGKKKLNFTFSVPNK